MRFLEAVAKPSFRLHPGLDPTHYEITNSLRDYKRWLAYSHQGFTASDPKNTIEIGQMAPIGYVMISLKDNTIVPISRGDEHHRGADVLYDQISKECKRNGHPINPRDYVPIWAPGRNYIYSERDIPDMLAALTKFMSYGGVDGPLVGANDMRKVMMNSSDFIARKGNIRIDPGTISPTGQRIIDGFHTLGQTLRAAIDAPEQVGVRGVRTKAIQAAAEFAAQLRPFLSNFAIDDYDILIDPKIIGAYKKSGDVHAVLELMFGPVGLKQRIHREMKAYLDRQAKGERNVWKDDEIVSLWGDVALAVDKFSDV